MSDTERALVQTLRNQRTYGKYRGFVVDNADPDRRGRVKVQVPALLGDQATDDVEHLGRPAERGHRPGPPGDERDALPPLAGSDTVGCCGDGVGELPAEGEGRAPFAADERGERRVGRRGQQFLVGGSD